MSVDRSNPLKLPGKLVQPTDEFQAQTETLSQKHKVERKRRYPTWTSAYTHHAMLRGQQCDFIDINITGSAKDTGLAEFINSQRIKLDFSWKLIKIEM